MTRPSVVDIQLGWKVFAKADEIGEVVDVGPSAIDIQNGVLRKHRYRVPETQIAEATDGVVDLDIDRKGLAVYEVGSQDGRETVGPPDDLPGEYRRLEFGADDTALAPDPLDGHDLPR